MALKQCHVSMAKLPVETWHCFPQDDAIRKEWIIKIRRDIGNHFGIKICLTHFV